jgi:ATP-dependent helicase/nuclease subunit A
MSARGEEDGRHPVLSTQYSALTEQQSRAVTTRGVSVVLSSGAGCGKTEVLTQRYVSHLRDDAAEIGDLVAITFTDRAAREMRARIRRTIREELAAAKSPADRERWRRHLRNLESAAISTIHSFCGSLLRQHSIAAGLDPRFEVLEDVLSSKLRDDALKDALQSLLTAHTEGGEDLRALVPLFGWPTTVAAIEGFLEAPDVVAWEEWGRRDTEKIAGEWLTRRRAELRRDYIGHVLTAEPDVASCLELLRTLPCGGPKMRANVETVLAAVAQLAGAEDLSSAVETVCRAAVVRGTEGAKAWPDEATYRRVQKALGDFRDRLKEKLALFSEEQEPPADAALVSQRFVRVAVACTRLYQDRKRRAAVVDFHDLLTLARDLLRGGPDVCGRLRKNLRFILIDELQDTDPVQMELVELICGPGLKVGSLFAVGDAKQSIYRFRGAVVELFQGLRETVPDGGRQQLSVNFRSQPQVLHFVNALFRAHLADYEPLSPNRAQMHAGPCVEFLWTGHGENESAQDGRRAEAERIAGRIAAMIGGDERLVVDKRMAELRPVRAGDIVLLFRSMSNVGLYEAALRKRGLDYYLVGGRAFFAQQEIYDLLNLLRALDNPQDAMSLAGTLRSPFGCLDDEMLYLLSRCPDGLWAGLHDDEILSRLPARRRAAAERSRRFLDRWRERKDRLPIAGLINFVLADCGYDAALQYEFLGDRKLANLWKLIDLARTFDRSGRFGLADFTARLGELVRSQPREEQAATLPEGADVIRLMSIHQAKGLEFPVVVLPDLGFAASGTRGTVRWDARLGCVVRPPTEEGPPLFSDFGWRLWKAREEMADWQEDLRTFYVACTRAQDYLILSATRTEPFKATNAAITILANRFRLNAGECRDESIPPEQRPLVRVVGPEVAFEGYQVRPEREPPPPLTAADLKAIRPIEVASREIAS